MNEKLLLEINSLAGKHHFLDQLMIFFAKDLVFIIFAGTAALMGYLLYKRRFRTVLWFAGSLVMSYLLLRLASLVYTDHRPFVDHHLTQLVEHAAGKSFPSDHTTVTAAIGMGLVLFTTHRKTGAAIFAAAILIGFSRIFVGIHYPVDILGGLIVGAAGAVATFILRRLSKKNIGLEKQS